MATLTDLDSARLRSYMGLTLVDSVSDGQLDISIDDAKSKLSGFTDDEKATRFYAAYLLAKSIDWNTLQRTGETSFFRPNPNTYKNLYDERLYDLGINEVLESSEGELPGIGVNQC